jgi:phage terminase large subunit-like protein
MLPRGQGKTSLTAVLALYELLAGPEGAQVVVVATDERQAGVCHRAASRMVELHPDLEARVQQSADASRCRPADRRSRSSRPCPSG